MFKLPSAAADLIVHNGLLAWLMSCSGTMSMDSKLSVGVIRIIGRLFKGLKGAEDSWHGRSGRDVWIAGFVSLVSGLIDRIEGCAEKGVVHEVLRLVRMVQEVSPTSRFSMRHLLILVDVVDALERVEEPPITGTLNLCSLGKIDVDLTAMLFTIIIHSPIVSDPRIEGHADALVSWTIKESLKAGRDVDTWLEWVGVCGVGEEVRARLAGHLKVLVSVVGGSGYRIMLVAGSGRKRGIEEVYGGDIELPKGKDIKRDMELSRKQWKVLLHTVERN